MEIKAVFKQTGSVVYHTKSPMFNELTTWILIFLFQMSYFYRFFNLKGFMRLFDLSNFIYLFFFWQKFMHLQKFQALPIMYTLCKNKTEISAPLTDYLGLAKFSWNRLRHESHMRLYLSQTFKYRYIVSHTLYKAKNCPYFFFLIFFISNNKKTKRILVYIPTAN